MRLEASPGEIRAAAAEQVFVRAVQETLPAESFAELRSLPNPNRPTQDELEGWAARWNVLAPCIVRVAPAWCHGFIVGGYNGPQAPEEWHTRIREICAQTPAIGPHVEYQPVISEQQEQIERKKLAAGRLKAAEDGNPYFEHGARQAERFWDQELPRLRQEATARALEHSLHPIVANPPYESLAEFQERARLHWEAMVGEAKRLGVTHEARSIEVSGDHLAWLVDYQIHQHSFQQIAQKNPMITEKGVRKSVERLATLLGLRLRAVPRGRPAGKGASTSRSRRPVRP